jgi:hypothetical protein
VQNYVKQWNGFQLTHDAGDGSCQWQANQLMLSEHDWSKTEFISFPARAVLLKTACSGIMPSSLDVLI